MHPLRRALVRLIDAAGALGACCVFCIFELMIIAGVGRQLNLQVSGVNDVVAWLCAAAAFFAMAHAFRHGDFVRVTLLLEAVPPKMRRVMDLVCLAIAAVSVAYLTYWATAFTWDSYQFKEVATGLVAIPIWIPQSTFVIGCWLPCWKTCSPCCRAARRAFSGRCRSGMPRATSPRIYEEASPHAAAPLPPSAARRGAHPTAWQSQIRGCPCTAGPL